MGIFRALAWMSDVGSTYLGLGGDGRCDEVPRRVIGGGDFVRLRIS